MAKAKSKAGIDNKKAAKEKEKTFKGKLTASTKYDSMAINMIFTILISAFILIVPFYRGLFFRINYIPAILFISALFSLYILYKCFDKSFTLIDTYMDIAVSAIPLTYAISFLFAANAKDASDTFLIYSSYFLLYKLTHSLIKSVSKNKDVFIHTIITSTFLLSFTFILHVMEVHSFSGIYVGKRLFGLYQYPNTTASVLGAGIILVLNILINTKKQGLKVLYQAVLTALVSAFIFTISRGGYLSLAVILILNFLLIDGRSKLKFVLSLLISFISNSLLIYKFYTIVETQPKAVGTHYFMSMIISAVLVSVLFFIKSKIKANISDKRINMVLLSAFLMLIIVISILFITKESLLLKLLPDAVANRVKNISVETTSVSSRIMFSIDGLKILKDYPLTGAGGGAWKNLYLQYQTKPYKTTETHNFYVQYATEVGFIGLAALAAVLFFLLKSMIKSIKYKSPYLHIYLAALLLLLHSAIDFNLSLAAVGYMLWMLIGILNSHDGIKTVNRPIKFAAKPLILVFALFILISSSSIYYGTKLGGQAVDNAKGNKDIDKAIVLFEKAGKFDRFNTAYRYDLAQVLNNQLRKTKDKKYYLSFKEQLSKIKKYEPYNHDFTPTICSMLLSIGEFDETASIADERIIHQPMMVAPYEMKIDVNYQIAKYLLEKMELEQSIPYLEKVLEAERQVKKVNEELRAIENRSKIIGKIKYLELESDFPEKVEAALRTLNMIKEDIEG